VYTEHSCAVNVAKYSPSGFYIASGDSSGKIRIWDTVNKEHLLKNEFQPIGGPIKGEKKIFRRKKYFKLKILINCRYCLVSR
jgi:WD40 repeat protein